VRRREFIGLLGAAAASRPHSALAQQGERVRKVGVLINIAENDPQLQAGLGQFRQVLQQLGWTEGRNIRIDMRFARSNFEQLPVLAKEVVASQPEVILVQTTPAVAALQKETRTIPTVFLYVSDPVGSGFISSLARPGGNLTGLLLYEEGIVGKWLGMLKEFAPQITHVTFISNPKTATYTYFLKAAEAVARRLVVEIVPRPVEAAADIQLAIESAAQVPNSGLFFPPNVTSTTNRALIIDLAIRHRLPAVYAFRSFTAEGGLMSYGVDEVDLLGRAATYVDRILRGEKPGDLPVQAPTKFTTVVNLKTAKALGLTVPPGILVGADEVIE
jgi:putative ABC transport system substrate-binding protein